MVNDDIYPNLWKFGEQQSEWWPTVQFGFPRLSVDQLNSQPVSSCSDVHLACVLLHFMSVVDQPSRQLCAMLPEHPILLIFLLCPVGLLSQLAPPAGVFQGLGLGLLSFAARLVSPVLLVPFFSLLSFFRGRIYPWALWTAVC